MIKFIEPKSTNNADSRLKQLIKKLLLKKYHLEGIKYDYANPVSVAEFCEYHLDLYLLGISQ